MNPAHKPAASQHSLHQVITNTRDAMATPWNSQNAPEGFDRATRWSLTIASACLGSFLFGVLFGVIVLL